MNLNRIKIQLTCSLSATVAIGLPLAVHPPWHHYPRMMTHPAPREPPRGPHAPWG
jgi:hypothetical protein